jgi:hypothetical protein
MASDFKTDPSPVNQCQTTAFSVRKSCSTKVMLETQPHTQKIKSVYTVTPQENPKKKKLIVPDDLRVNHIIMAYKEETPVPKIGTQRKNVNDESTAKMVCKETPRKHNEEVMSSKGLCEANSKKKKLIVPDDLRVNHITLIYKETTVFRVSVHG